MSFVRPEVSEAVLLKTIEEVTRNIGNKINKKGRGVFVSNHESLGIITEEYKELIDATKLDDIIDIASETMDIAVACIWSLASLLQKEESLKDATKKLNDLQQVDTEDDGN